MPESGKNQSFKINDAQRTRLEEYCRNRGWEFGAAPYAHWKVKGDKLSIVAYQSGALTIQGKNAPDFIQFVLEPDILGEFQFNTLRRSPPPRMVRAPRGRRRKRQGRLLRPPRYRRRMRR